MWTQWKTLVPYLRPHRKAFVVAMLCGAVAGAASGFGAPFFMQQVFARFFEEQDVEYTLAYQISVAALLPGIFVLRGISLYVNQFLLNRVGQNVLLRLRQDLFDHLQRLHLGYFERERSGDLVARLAADTTQIQNTVIILIKEAVLQPFIFLGGLGFLLFLSAREREIGFLLLLFAIVPLTIVPVRMIGGHLRRRGRQMQESFGDIAEAISENLRGSAEVRAFNREARESARFGERLEAYFAYAMKMTKYYLMTQPLMELVAVTVLSGAFLYAYNQGLGSSVFLAMGGGLYFTVDSIKRLVRALNEWQRTEGAFGRVRQVMDTEPAIVDARDPKPLGRVTGRIEFREVSFSYGEQTALHGIDVSIKAGTVCALVGPSGAGKSTFSKLILRFYDPTAGAVLLDGEALRSLRLADLREQIAYVPQNPALFNDTVANNIRLGREDASDTDVEAAARAAYAHEFIEMLPEGYGTVVGENANRLSGGQRQRLALARAFLRAAPVLILDEATSALDSASEEKIRDALRSLIRGRTVLIVAHRFSTIELAQRILVFEGGRIVADGSREEVLSHPTFSELSAKQ